MLDLRSFIVKKLPEDGTLVSKRVGVGTKYGVLYDVLIFIIHNNKRTTYILTIFNIS